MADTYCQPCKSQSKDNKATVWCIACEQFLCEGCHNYHKVLKITKNHVVITSEDYRDIEDFLCLLDTKCEFHPEREIKYHCSTHNNVCCVLCKNQKHRDCKNVKLIDEVETIDEMYSQIKMFSKKVSDRISVLDTLCNDRTSNIKKLENQRDEFLNKLKDNKDKINVALDKLESELKSKFEIGYQFEKRKTEGQLEMYNTTKANWQKVHAQLVKINQHKPLSCLQLYLTEQHLKKRNNEEDLAIKQFAEKMSETVFECSLSLNISESNRSIIINDKIKIASSKPKCESQAIMEAPMKQETGENENEITDSSTIEEEKTATEEDDAKPENDSQDGTNDNKQNMPSSKVDKTGAVDMKKAPLYKFSYSNKITVSKRCDHASIRCVKHLPNGLLIFGEESQKSLLICGKSGDLRGQINIKCIPESIAIIDNNRVAVSAGTAVSIVNFHTFTVEKKFVQSDDCYGIAFVNQTLLVNCETTGLKVLDLSGNLIKTFSSIKGSLYLTVIEPDILIYVESGSQIVYFFNMTTEGCTRFKCPNLREVTGITIDDKKNVYVSCYESDKIYTLRFGSEKWETVLTAKDKIYQPECIDFDKDALYIVNDRKIAYTYRLQPQLARYVSLPCLSKPSQK